MSMTDTREPGAVSIATVQAPTSESLERRARGIAPHYGPAYWISGGLALVTALATALTFFVPDVLRGTAVMNGSGRGTALVALIIGVPTLVVSMLVVARGSTRGMVVWLGAVAFLLYQSVLLLLATPVPLGSGHDGATVHFADGRPSRLSALRHKKVGPPKIWWHVDYSKWFLKEGIAVPRRIEVTWEDERRPWLSFDLDGFAANVEIEPRLRQVSQLIRDHDRTIDERTKG